MERNDKKAKGWEKNDQTVLSGNGREAELIVAGLKLLSAQIAIRDVTSERDIHGARYPYGSRAQSEGVPLSGEVEQLLGEIGSPSYAPEADVETKEIPLLNQTLAKAIADNRI